MELEADLFEFFGIDLVDVARGNVSLRRLVVLVARLVRMPGRSAVSAALYPESAWSQRDYLTAEMIDRLELSNWLFLKANSEEASRLDPPKPFPRPGDETSSGITEFASVLDVHNFMTQLNSA